MLLVPFLILFGVTAVIWVGAFFGCPPLASRLRCRFPGRVGVAVAVLCCSIATLTGFATLLVVRDVAFRRSLPLASKRKT